MCFTVTAAEDMLLEGLRSSPFSSKLYQKHFCEDLPQSLEIDEAPPWGSGLAVRPSVDHVLAVMLQRLMLS